MKEQIINKLKQIEQEKGIKFLFAIESGSRVWRFESKDSDYDIRCVHYYPANRYIELDYPQQQIEIMDGELDIVSWDIHKFFNLFMKSNPSVSEWLSSDIIYIDNDYRKQLQEYFDNCFSSTAIKMHYLSMAKQNYYKYIDKNTKVELKKYVYVLRALACFMWLQVEGCTPPLDYNVVKKYLRNDIEIFFDKCVKLKRTSESELGERDEMVDRWIEHVMNTEVVKYEPIEINKEYLNEIIRSLVK